MLTCWRRSAFWAVRVAISWRIDERVRNHSGIEVTGRTAWAAAASTGPNTSPIARRAGSIGESVPPW